MYAHELYEQNKPRIVVTYPGRFQPFHQGHAEVFGKLQKKFGADSVYLLTSNDTSSAKSPFNFSDKYQLITAAGVPGDKIIETNQMYILPDNVDPTSTIFITAVGSPDKDRLNPDSFLKKDKKDKEGNIIKPAGSPSYYKSWDDSQKPVTADQHGYVIVIPEIKKSITIKGETYDVSHGTETRNLWNMIRNDDEARKEFLKQMYQRPSLELGQIFDKIPQAAANEDVAPDSQSTTSPIHGIESKNSVSEDQIQEIERAKSDIEGYSTQNQIINSKILSKIKMLPGSNRFGYIAGAGTSVFTGAEYIIDLYDVKHPKQGARQVGYLALRSAPWFPVRNSYQVANVAIDEEYRGLGLGQNLYGIAMKLLKMTIIADESQTPQARSSWVRLSKIPGVSINGYASIFAQDWFMQNNPEEIYDDSAVRLIRALNRADGQEIGRNQDFVYVSFPVGANADKGELQSIQKGIAIYSAQHPEEGGTPNGLYARWTGLVNEQTLDEDAAGVGVVAANKKMAKDPRYSMSITKDVKPSTPKNMLRAFRLSENETNISEEEIMDMVKKFLPLAMKELQIKKLPRIILKKHVETHDGQATFGRFVDADEKIYIGIADRHPVDILRTLAHELVHFKQYEDGKMYKGAGETGSPIENEAHVKAGIIMRHFNKKYPDSVRAQGVEIDESREQTIEEKYAFILNEDLDTLEENFADGRNPQDKGDSKRYNIPTKGSVSSLRKIAKQGGRKGQLAHWMANMKSGKAKKK